MNLDAQTREALSLLFLEIDRLTALRQDLQQMGGVTDANQAQQLLKKVRKILKFFDRVRRPTARHIQTIIKAVSEASEQYRIDNQLTLHRDDVVRALYVYSDDFNHELAKLKDLMALEAAGNRKHDSATVSEAQTELRTTLETFEQHVGVLVQWIDWIQREFQTIHQQLSQQQASRGGLNRRQSVVAGVLAAVGLGSSSVAFAAGTLGIKYVTYKREMALRLPVRPNMSYALIARYATGKESNWTRIRRFNDNKGLHPGQYIYIEQSLLTRELKIILDENKFSTFEIDDNGSLAAIMDTNVNWRRFGYNQTLRMLLVINHDINYADPVMYENQKIIIPTSLLSPTLITEQPKASDDRVVAREVPTPPPKPPKRAATSDDRLIARMGQYQNPYRLNPSRVYRTLRARDLFGATRVRGRRISSKGHQGLDLPAVVGTRLFPIGVGRVSEIKDYKGTRYWRNGKSIRIRTAFGYEVTYIHMQRFRRGLKVGDVVDLDTVVGYVGISGNASRLNPHVHIQVKYNGKIIDPKSLVFPRLTRSGKNAELQASIGNNRALYLRLFRRVDREAF